MQLCVTLAAGLVALTASGAPQQAAGGIAVGTQDNPSHYNVILYVLDTTRADHFGMYGYERNTTPFIDSLADEGVSWSRCHASSSWTIPSVVSMLTGLNVQTHKALSWTLAVDDGWVTLPTLLKEHGYTTAMVTSNDALWPRGRGIRDRFDYARFTVRPDEQLTDRMIGFLETPGIEPFFIHAQPRAAHAPYHCPEPYDSLFVNDEFYGNLGDVPQINLNNTCVGGIKIVNVIDDIESMDWYVAQYDGLIAYMDNEIRRLFETLDSQGMRENTLVVITADHGEELAGERGLYFCHRDHYEGNYHVPLIMLLPEQFQREYGPFRGLELGGNPNHADLMPTILDLLDINGPNEMQGRSLRQEIEPHRGIANDNNAHAFRSGDHKLIHRSRILDESQKRELYDLSSDPAELYDLSEEMPGLTDALESEMLRVARYLDAIIPADRPEGTIFSSGFDSEDVIDDHIHTPIRANPKVGWRWEEPGLLHGWTTWKDTTQTESYYATAGLISAPRSTYDMSARVQLLNGTLQISTCWADWLGHGYRLYITEDTVTLRRFDRTPNPIDLGERPHAFSLGEWHHVRIAVDRTKIRVFIDGTEVLSSGDVDLHETWGTTLFSTDQAGEAYVDDLEINVSPVSDSLSP